MADFILREIDKLGQLLEALLRRVGVRRTEEEEPQAARTELIEALGEDLDTLLADQDFVGRLRRERGFEDRHLEQLAELLADLVAATEVREEKLPLIGGVMAIYRDLDARGAEPSLNRYYILEELGRGL